MQQLLWRPLTNHRKFARGLLRQLLQLRARHRDEQVLRPAGIRGDEREVHVRLHLRPVQAAVRAGKRGGRCDLSALAQPNLYTQICTAPIGTARI